MKFTPPSVGATALAAAPVTAPTASPPPLPAPLPKLLWKPSPNFYPGRGGARVDKIIVHDTEGSYGSAVAWFAQRASRVSAHFVVKEDGSEATQMVDVGDSAWHVCAFNRSTIGVEMAGFAAKGFGSSEWLAVASIVAFHLHHLQLPNKWAKGGVGPGFCRHYDLGRAGGGHSDPTTDDKKWLEFCAMVTAAYDHGNFPALWEAEHDAHKCLLREGR